jgi:hypothetical protein
MFVLERIIEIGGLDDRTRPDIEPVASAIAPSMTYQRERTLQRALNCSSFLSTVLVRDLSKSAEDMPVVEFTDLEIGSAAKRHRTSVTKYLPKPLRPLNRGGRARAVNGFTSRDAAISEIEGQSHERNDLCHRRCSSAPQETRVSESPQARGFPKQPPAV